MGKVSEQMVREALREVNDPELGANIVDLGMVRQVTVGKGGKVQVDLVLTTPGCPMAGLILYYARRRVSLLSGVKEVEIRVLDEPWQGPPTADWQDWLNRIRGR